MVNPATFFNGLCIGQISADILEPQSIEDTLEIRELKELIAVLEKSVRDLKVNVIDSRDLKNEDSNILINKLAEYHGNSENIGLLKKFCEKEILEVLEKSIQEPDIKRGVAKVIRRIYLDSFANDPEILNLAKYLKENIHTFRHMFKNLKGLKNLPEREVESITQKIQEIKTLGTDQQVKELQGLLKRDVFKFCGIQGILDKTTLRRLDDYLKYKRSQFKDDCISGFDFNLIKSHILLIEKIVKLQKQINQQLDSLEAQSKISYVKDSESYYQNKNMLLSAYSEPLWNAVFERVVELVHDSYNTNQPLQRKLVDIGFNPNRNDVITFLNYENFNKFLDSYFSDKSIDDLVYYFLNSLSDQKLAELSSSIKERSKDAQKNVLLNGFRTLEISFEDL